VLREGQLLLGVIGYEIRAHRVKCLPKAARSLWHLLQCLDDSLSLGIIQKFCKMPIVIKVIDINKLIQSAPPFSRFTL